MTAVPAVIVLVYLFSIIVMTRRAIPVASAAVPNDQVQAAVL
jgi:hypothetical protein